MIGSSVRLLASCTDAAYSVMRCASSGTFSPTDPTVTGFRAPNQQAAQCARSDLGLRVLPSSAGKPISADEFDALLRDRLDLSRAEVISALKTMPARGHGSTSLPEHEARLLDRAGLVAPPGTYAAASAVEVLASVARLIKTAYSIT